MCPQELAAKRHYPYSAAGRQSLVETRHPLSPTSSIAETRVAPCLFKRRSIELGSPQWMQAAETLQAIPVVAARVRARSSLFDAYCVGYSSDFL
jgi:hypothetical protein